MTKSKGYKNYLEYLVEVFNINNKRKILSIGNNFIILDQSYFYPGGGGQDKDIGFLFNDNFKAEIVDVEEIDDGYKVTLKDILGEIKWDFVYEIIDIKRRYNLARSHSAEHLLTSMLLKHLKDYDAVLDKAEIHQNEGVIFLKCNCDKLKVIPNIINAVAEANEIIKANVPIVEHIFTKDELMRQFEFWENKGLRIKLDRIKAEKIRLIEIVGYDVSACKGTHVFSTSEIGVINVDKVNTYKHGLAFHYSLTFPKNALELYYKFMFLNLDNPFEQFVRVNERYKRLRRDANALMELLLKQEYVMLDDVKVIVLNELNPQSFARFLKDIETKILLLKKIDSGFVVCGNIALEWLKAKDFKGKDDPVVGFAKDIRDDLKKLLNL